MAKVVKVSLFELDKLMPGLYHRASWAQSADTVGGVVTQTIDQCGLELVPTHYQDTRAGWYIVFEVTVASMMILSELPHQVYGIDD